LPFAIDNTVDDIGVGNACQGDVQRASPRKLDDDVSFRRSESADHSAPDDLAAH